MSQIESSEIYNVLIEKLKNINLENNFSETGRVIKIGDGIAIVDGLDDVEYGEMVIFQNKQIGMVQNLEMNNIGIIVFYNFENIKEGDTVKRTRNKVYIKAGYGLLGRVVNTLTEPIDGLGRLQGELYDMPIERKSPGVIYRQPVTEPLQTGIISIDSMIPIGRGQRELIIGDRQTGKTSIAIDTILNQKKLYDEGNPVYCIYVAIGQKKSNVASVMEILKKYGADKYTCIVSASAADSAAMQVYSAMTGTAIGEFFRDTGKSCLIIYDDLSKQAVAYREISLLLKRPPGREAYPGDVFYLHSRILERSAKIINDTDIANKMNDVPKSIKHMIKGGGSLTALPIIETQDGDVSAYIPTNVISITDGQIFLESELFNSGVRPAINVGISVSRVGGSAQINSMKKVSGTLKLDQAQYRELESFSKFGSDLDVNTMEIINKGQKNSELLKQKVNNPFPIEEQIIVIYIGIKNLLKDVSLHNIIKYRNDILKIFKNKHSYLLNEIKKGNWSKNIENEIENIVNESINIIKLNG